MILNSDKLIFKWEPPDNIENESHDQINSSNDIAKV